MRTVASLSLRRAGFSLSSPHAGFVVHEVAVAQGFLRVLLSLTFREPCIVIYSYKKSQRMHYFSTLFGKELYMFRADLLSIIRSLNTVFTAIGICHTSYVDCLLARSGKNRSVFSCHYFLPEFRIHSSINALYNHSRKERC
jgi:hypothetical protein